MTVYRQAADRMQPAIIQWAEVDGQGMLFCDYEDGTRHTEPWDEPIGPGTDSWEIARVFGDPRTVDHDGEYIHVG